MLRFIRSRLLSALLVLAVVSAASFALIWLVPGDVAASLADPGASAEEIQRIRARLGLDKPKAQQVAEWYANLARGSLGDSILLNRPVTSAILERLPVTMTIATLAFAIALVIGVAIGILAATRHGRWIDQAAMTLGVIGLSIPEFWLALMAIFLVLPLIGTHALYERKSARYIFLHTGFWAINFTLMGGIISQWA